MSTSEEFTNYVLDQLSSIGLIHTSKMFGGVLLKIDGTQLGVIIEDVLYFNVKELELQTKLEDMGSEQFTYTRKDKTEPVVIKNWWSVPEETVEDKDELVSLANNVLSQINL